MLSKLKVTLIVLSFLGGPINAERFSEPKLPPEEILERVDEYVASKRPDIKSEEYELTNLSFDYRDGRWWVMYDCVNQATPGCHFGVWVSNSIDPEFRYFAGE